MTVKRTPRWLPILLIPLAGASAPLTMSVKSVSPAVALSATAVKGEYVEARTASVFAGACHYNGERVTEGRSAVLAWSISDGSFDGVDLAGVKLMAAIGCDDNLAEPAAARRSELTVDADSDARAAAAVAWVKSQCASQLGTVGSVRRANVTFDHASEKFTISAKNFAAMTVQPMPDRACCSQPQNVWYPPLMPVDDRRVGYTVSAECDAAGVGTWQRSDENSAIYGTFGR